MAPPAPEKFLARVCWNSNSWTCPSGEAAISERAPGPRRKQPYTVRLGFGHEEWLFSYQWVLGGWKYGYLQPVGRSYEHLKGRTIELYLYTIAPGKQRFYVAHLPVCEVISEDLARATLTQFKKRGWLAQMIQQVKAVNGKVGELDDPAEAHSLFNVRFRPDAIEVYRPLREVGPNDFVRKLKRYTIVPLIGRAVPNPKRWGARRGTSTHRPTGVKRRPGVPEGVLKLLHNQLQNNLFDLLVDKYGEGSVLMEDDFADIAVRRGGSLSLIEVKSDYSPRYAIRDALGQLLEYSFVARSKGSNVSELIVAAPGEASQQEQDYLDDLRKRFGLPLRYVCFRDEMSSVNI